MGDILDDLIPCTYTSPSKKTMRGLETKEYSRAGGFVVTAENPTSNPHNTDWNRIFATANKIWSHTISFYFFDPNAVTRSKIFIKLLQDRKTAGALDLPQGYLGKTELDNLTEFTAQDKGRINTEGKTVDVQFATWGIGKLEHPIAGSIYVLPVNIVEKMSVVKNIGRVVVRVTFLQQLLPILTSDLSPYELAFLAESTWADAIAGVVQKMRDFRTSNATIVWVTKALNAVKNVTSEIIDVIAIDPLSAATKIAGLIRRPMESVGSVTTKVNFLLLAVKELSASYSTDIEESYSTKAWANYITQITTISAVLFSEPSDINIYNSRDDALYSATMLQEIEDNYILNMEATETKIGFNTQEKTFKGQEYVSDTEINKNIKFLITQRKKRMINDLYSLGLTKTYFLETDRNPIELCIELYGSLDLLQLFYKDNNILGDEIFILKAGRKIIYTLQ